MAKASLLNAGQVQPSHRSEGPRHAGRDSAGQSRWAVGRSSSIATGAWGGPSFPEGHSRAGPTELPP